jgi:hypothetical protein
VDTAAGLRTGIFSAWSHKRSGRVIIHGPACNLTGKLSSWVLPFGKQLLYICIQMYESAYFSGIRKGSGPAACRHGIHRQPAGTRFTGEPAGTGFDSSSKGKDKTVTGYDVKGIS